MRPELIRASTQSTVALGGIAALSWEVLWQLESSLSLGVSALGTAITLAITMAGMTIGSLLMGAWLRDRVVTKPLLLYGALEAIIGVSGLFLLSGFGSIESFDARLFSESPELAPALHIASIALLLGPATMAMGATIPVFELVGRSTGTSVARLYGINTAGAAIGVVALSFAFLPNLGVNQTCSVIAAINFLAVLSTILLDRLTTSAPTPELTPSPPTPEPITAHRFGPAALVVFVTGFVTFGLEVAWFRSLRAAFQSTTESFAIILASVLIPLALAARMVPRFRRTRISPREVLFGAAAAIFLATPLIEQMDSIVRFYIEWLSGGEQGGSNAGPSVDYFWLLIIWLGTSIVVMGPSIFFLGVSLPWYLEEFADPGDAGRIYAVNTMGAVAGSLLCAWILLPAVGFAQCAWMLGIATAGAALVAPGERRLWPGVFATVAALMVAVTFTADLGVSRVQGPSRLHDHKVVSFAEGVDSTVAVLEGPVGVRRLLIDGFVATSEDMQRAMYMHWMGRLPMLLHEDPKNALVICFGTGQTANAVRQEGSEHLDIVDVSDTVLGMAQHFTSNEGVLEDPGVQAIVMDGRAWLRRTNKTYDVITLEPMPPYFAGVNSLYSREFYEIAKSRLAPDGIMAQWLPIHLLPPVHASSVVATFIEVFPDAILWMGPQDSTGILLGRATPAKPSLGRDWPGLLRDFERPLPGPIISGSALLGVSGLVTFATPGKIITDDNQLLAYGLLRRDLIAGHFQMMQKLNHRRLHTISRIQPFRRP